MEKDYYISHYLDIKKQEAYILAEIKDKYIRWLENP